MTMASKLRTFTYSTQSEKAQNRLRSEWPWSIETKLKTKMSGLFTAESKIGSPPPKEGPRRQSPNCHSLLLFCLLCLLFTFNAETKDITIGSHNLHQFKTSAEYHKSCIKSHGGIWFGQELWLSEKQLPQLHQLDAQFVARSGMEEAVASGVLRGRPFGGVSIAWSPDLNHVISPLPNYKHKRVVAVELATSDKNIILMSAYFPFYDTNNRATYMAEYTDTISMIEIIINDHPHHLFIVGGDLNCELNGGSPFDRLWAEFSSKNRFAYCNHLFSSPGYTYHHLSLGHKKMNDHFFVSQELIDHNQCHGFKILDEGQNPSDHLPITMKVLVEIQATQSKENSIHYRPKLN